MNLITYILNFLVASQVNKKSADSVTRDESFPLLVSPKVFKFIEGLGEGHGDNFFPYIVGICANDAVFIPGKVPYDRVKCTAKYQEWRSAAVDAITNYSREYDQEVENATAMRYAFENTVESGKLFNLFGRLAEQEKDEHYYVLQVFNGMQMKLMGRLMAEAGINRFKLAFDFVQKVYKNSGLVDAVAAYSKQRPAEGESIIENFKKWVIANIVFGDRSTAPNNPNPFNLITPEFNVEEYVRSLTEKNPDRFKISPIGKNMNLEAYFRFFPEETMNFYTQKMRRVFLAYRRKSASAAWSADNAIRDQVFGSVLNEAGKEDLYGRIRLLERLIQAIMLGTKIGEPFKEDLVEKVVKLWLMSKQMIEPDGWMPENAKFGLHDAPEDLLDNFENVKTSLLEADEEDENNEITNSNDESESSTLSLVN